MYNLRNMSGPDNMTISRIGTDCLQLKLGTKEFTVLTEDLAALVREELPKDRAAELFSETETASISQGKARVAVKAQHDIKQGEEVRFTIDINKYMDSKGVATGVRVAPKSGLIF